MAQPLPVAIDIADAFNDTTYGISVFGVLSMHDTWGRVWTCAASPTFRRNLTLLNWGGQANIARAGAVVGGWFRRSLPAGFSTRGLGVGSLDVVSATGWPSPSIPIDFTVRLDPGLSTQKFLPLSASVQIEVEKLSAPGGTAIGGVTLKAVEDGALVRAVGPSVENPALDASYTLTIDASPIIP